MEKNLIIFCHPLENSLNYSIKETICKELRDFGYIVNESNLYQDGFNSNSINQEYILRERAKILEANVLIFQFPLYFGGFPALLHD